MTSVVEYMPNPMEKEVELDGMTLKSRASISVVHSIKDWWNFSSDLLSATDGGTSDKAKLKNKMIEYELITAILSNDIYVKPPNEPDNASKQGKIYGELLDIEVESGLYIHEFYLENNLEAVKKEDETHIVVIHGYMAAFGYFIKNVEAIIKSRPGVRLHMIDMLGFGNSSRPKFPSEFIEEPDSITEKITQILQIENWFIDRIESWRLQRDLRHFKLIGHSMGAYISSCYLMKYNNQYNSNEEDDFKIVDQFLIVSPMGTESSPLSLLNQKKYQFNHHEAGGDPFKELIATPDDEEISEELVRIWEKVGKPRFPKNFILRKLWEYNMSPFQILQKAGPFYSKILSYWSFQRFRNMKSNSGDQSVDLILKLHRYSYSVFNQFQGSGELAITKLINHEILAKLPLSDRGFVEYLVASKVDTLWLYGDRDWMNVNGGKHVFEKIHKIDKNLASFKIIENAGHHLYLDNPDSFNLSTLKFFKLV